MYNNVDTPGFQLNDDKEDFSQTSHLLFNQSFDPSSEIMEQCSRADAI